MIVAQLRGAKFGRDETFPGYMVPVGMKAWDITEAAVRDVADWLKFDTRWEYFAALSRHRSKIFERVKYDMG